MHKHISIYIYILHRLTHTHTHIYIYIYISVVHSIRFQTFFYTGIWKFSMLLLYILWDDWPIFNISGSKEQLQQQLEYTLLKPDYHSWRILKMQSGRKDTLEERYAIKLCFKLGKKATETYGIPQTAFGTSCMSRASVFEWHKIYKEVRKSVRDDKRCGKSKEVNRPELIRQRARVRVTREFSKRFLRKRQALFKSGQWHFHQDNAPVHNSILVTDYLTKMGIKTVPRPPYSPDLVPCDFCLFPKLRGCRYEIIEKKEAVTKVIATLTQEEFQGPSRSCWNGATSALQPEEITLKGNRVSFVFYQ